MDYKFEDYWRAMQPAARYEDRKIAAEFEWDHSPEKQAPIMAWLKRHGPYPDRNPFFFIQDFTVKSKPREPTFLRGDEGGDLVQVKYNGKFLICTRTTMELFGLEWVCDWLPKRD